MEESEPKPRRDENQKESPIVIVEGKKLNLGKNWNLEKIGKD